MPADPPTGTMNEIPRLVLKGGNVFDGTGAPPYRADVAIHGGKIAELGLDLQGDDVVDVLGATVMPGLIDCHAHPAFVDASLTLDADAGRAASYVTLQSLAGLRATLEAGVTTVRDAAGADAGLRQALQDGLIPGPRLLVSLSQLSPSAGPYDSRSLSGLDTWVARPGIPGPVADGPDGLRAKVREYVQAGADVIKIFASGNFAMPRDGARRSIFTDAELVAIIDEARRHRIRVMAHAHGDEAGFAAARAGAASIEHGFYLGPAALDAMAAAGTVFVPTLLAAVGIVEQAADQATRERFEAIAEGHRAVVREAHRRGIPIAMGTDCPVAPHGRNAEELLQLVACGLSPWEALAAGTSVAARLLGIDDEVGRVTPGLDADLLVLDGDPAAMDGFGDRLRHVLQRGRRVGPRPNAPAGGGLASS